MSTEDRRPVRLPDSPCQRLRWTLPLALVTTGLALWTLAGFLTEPAPRPPEPVPIEAQVIELPASQPAHAATPPRPMAQSPRPAEPVHVQPVPVVPSRPVTTTPAPAAPAHAAPAAVPTPPAPQAAAATKPAMAASGAATSASNGPQAVYHPLPKIPDELREEALDASATARFAVAADGSVTVALTRPTQDPRLNRLLLDTLGTWRFFPAVKDGKPVASTTEVVVKLLVQ